MMKDVRILIIVLISAVILGVVSSFYAPWLLFILFTIALTAAFGYGTWTLLTWIQAHILDRMFPELDEESLSPPSFPRDDT